mmetsp:Transcript_8129/g.17529  ORF Transcript_8129/g.17529 Transcript_8129/m.17529 type:complete len:226 (-) Transcript_8129:232-909(-)
MRAHGHVLRTHELPLASHMHVMAPCERYTTSIFKNNRHKPRQSVLLLVRKHQHAFKLSIVLSTRNDRPGRAHAHSVAHPQSIHSNTFNHVVLREHLNRRIGREAHAVVRRGRSWTWRGRRRGSWRCRCGRSGGRSWSGARVGCGPWRCRSCRRRSCNVANATPRRTERHAPANSNDIGTVGSNEARVVGYVRISEVGANQIGTIEVDVVKSRAAEACFGQVCFKE